MRKQIINFLVLFSCIVAAGSCKQGLKNGISEIKTADSVTVIYYDRPPDNRFFKITKVPVVTQLNSIINDVNASASKSTDGCESIGKVYFYKGTEQVYVVYFSDRECSELSYIRNGEKYTTSMSPATWELLEKLKTLSRVPSSKP